MSGYQRVVAALEARGSARQGDNWQCPAHDDEHPSLSVHEAEDGSALISCHAGCKPGDVVRALGLTWPELFGDGRSLRLFDDEPYAPVRRSAWLALPASAARDFGVAVTFGRMLCTDGSYRRAVTGHHVVARVLGPRSLTALREALGCSAAHLRKLVLTWRRCGLAHRCNRQTLVLFMRPLDECPACRNAAVADDMAPSKRSCGERYGPQSVPVGNDRPLGTFPTGTLSSTDEHQPSDGFSRDVVSAEATREKSQVKAPARAPEIRTHEVPGGRVTVWLYAGSADTPPQMRGYDGRRALDLLERDIRAGRFPPWGHTDEALRAVQEERESRGW